MPIEYHYLDKINSRADFLALPESAMPELCREIRDFLVENVTVTGGHLASNLGIVELTVALHRVFDPEKDHILFDTGHQCYVHKILTGRKDKFPYLRIPGGLSGFPSRSESPADAFGAGHSGTAVSAAIGFAESDKRAGNDRHSVAVVGDGAYTNGTVHEAMNNAGASQRLIVILNENEMSISRNIGVFAAYLAKVRASRSYVRAKKTAAKVLTHIPLIGKSLHRVSVKIKQRMKNKLYNSNYFEDLGFFYIGPIDGNDYKTVRNAVEEARLQGENVFLHVKTKKGMGYAPAEENPSVYHSLPPSGKEPPATSFHSVFGETLLSIAESKPRVVAVTAAMEYGTGLHAFAKAFPDRFYDVGIAEEHALLFAAGTAAAGDIPFFAVYSPFLQRGYDNILNDVVLQRLPVKIAVDRAGLALSDGATHHGIYDVAFLATIPGISLYAPATYGSLRAILWRMAESPLPEVVRYPNRDEDARVRDVFYPERDYDAFGVRPSWKGDNAPKAVIVTYGDSVSVALDAWEALCADGQRVGILLLEKLCPYDETENAVYTAVAGSSALLFLECGVYSGGCGMNLATRLREHGYTGKIKILAIRDDLALTDKADDPYDRLGIGQRSVIDAVRSLSDQ